MKKMDIYHAHELHTEKRRINTLLNRILRNRDFRREKMIIKFADLILQANDKHADYIANLYNTDKPLIIENHEKIVID